MPNYDHAMSNVPLMKETAGHSVRGGVLGEVPRRQQHGRQLHSGGARRQRTIHYLPQVAMVVGRRRQIVLLKLQDNHQTEAQCVRLS